MTVDLTFYSAMNKMPIVLILTQIPTPHQNLSGGGAGNRHLCVRITERQCSGCGGWSGSRFRLGHGRLRSYLEPVVKRVSSWNFGKCQKTIEPAEIRQILWNAGWDANLREPLGGCMGLGASSIPGASPSPSTTPVRRRGSQVSSSPHHVCRVSSKSCHRPISICRCRPLLPIATES